MEPDEPASPTSSPLPTPKSKTPSPLSPQPSIRLAYSRAADMTIERAHREDDRYKVTFDLLVARENEVRAERLCPHGATISYIYGYARISKHRDLCIIIDP